MKAETQRNQYSTTNLPKGWTKKVFNRSSGGTYTYYYNLQGQKFRSFKEVERFLDGETKSVTHLLFIKMTSKLFKNVLLDDPKIDTANGPTVASRKMVVPALENLAMEVACSTSCRLS